MLHDHRLDILFFLLFHQINQTDRIDQTNSPRLASPARRALPALCPSNQIYEIDRYGSPFSQESINNPFGAGSPYRLDSPTNLYGRGLRIEGK